MQFKWKILFAHKWSDHVYDLGVRYLKGETLQFNNPKQKYIFQSRMSMYSLDGERIVHVTKDKYNTNDTNLDTTYVYKVIKESEIEDVLKTIMADPMNHALGKHTLYDKVIRQFYLGISRQKVHEFLKRDNSLRIHNNMSEKPIISSFRPEYPMQHWQMDITHLDRPVIVKQNKNYKYILVIIDIFSKYVYMYPLKEKSAENIAKWLLKLFLTGDIPMILHSDNAQEFTGQILSNVCMQFNVIQRNGSVYSPQTQGFVENKNKHIKNLLNYYFIKYDTYKYYDILDRVCFTINNTIHSVTGYTPLQIHRGRDPFVTNQYKYTGNVEEIKLQRNEKINYEQYFEKSLNLEEQNIIKIKNRISNEAIKRETKQIEKQNDYRINNPVKITSYTKENYEITAIQLRLKRIINGVIEYKKIQNPLTIKKLETRIHVNTIDSKPETMYQKIDKKRYKVFPDIYKIKNRTVNERQKTLTRYELSTINDEWIVERMINGPKNMWTSVFYSSHLLGYELNQNRVTNQEKFLFIDPFDNDSWYSGKEKKKQESVQKIKSIGKEKIKMREINYTKKNREYFENRDIYREFYHDDTKETSSVYRSRLNFIERTKNTKNDKLKNWYKATQYDDDNYETIADDELFDKDEHITIQPRKDDDKFTDDEIIWILENTSNIPIIYGFQPSDLEMKYLPVAMKRATIISYKKYNRIQTRSKLHPPVTIKTMSYLKPENNEIIYVNLKSNMYNKMNEIHGWKFDGENVINYLKELLVKKIK